MILSPSAEPASAQIAVDKFIQTAHNNIALMKFIEVAVDVFERKGTMKLIMDIKAGEAKGGEGSFKF